MSQLDADTVPGRQPGMLAGVTWLLAFRVIDRAIGLISIMILARLLLPEHFGIVALGSTVVALIDLFAALGLDTILVQSRYLTRTHYDTAWTIQVGVAIFCALLLIATAVPAAWFFREPRIEPIIYALSVPMLLQGARNIRIVDFRREMRFDKEFVLLGTRRLSGFVVTTLAAFILRNQWALVCGVLTSAVVGLVLSYVMRPYRPKVTLARWQELLAKSSWIMASNFVMFVRMRSSDFLLGRAAGSSVVGTYNLAAELGTIISTELVAPINRVALSDFSLQGTREMVVQRFDQLTGILAIVLIPLGVGLSATAELIVPLLFGPAWAQATAPLKFLALAGLIAGLGSNFGVVLLSLGYFSRDTILHTWGAVLLLPMLTVGVFYAGAIGAAIAVLVANAMTVLIALLYMRRDIGYGPLCFLMSIWRPAVAAALMYGVVVMSNTEMAWLNDHSAWLRLAVLVVIGAVIYLITLGALWGLRGFADGAERRTLAIAGRLIGRVIRR